MADEIARLGVAVDSTSAVSAVKDIEALAVAGDKASASAKKLKTSWDGMSMSPAHLFSANKGLQDFRKEAAEAAVAAKRVDDSWKKNLFSTGHMMKANAGLREFRASMAAASQATAAAAAPAKILAASHHQVAKAAVGYTKSAKEMAFATRNLPAQFTDIAVSLQAGQNPLTVLLQQGGQLKDMFGGIGPAAKALGGYVAGLVNPYTVAAAAVAALGIAWIQGDAEARSFQKTLEMQGNTLGVTTGDLMSAAEGMERFGQSQGAAADALNQTAASGKIFGDSISTVAQAAMNMEREAGQAIEKTVEQFASLAGEPIDAAVKLDEQYKFLTISVYDQIRALEEQGDKMGAAEVAMDALASTMNQRTADIEGNLGTLQKSWRLVANAAKWAWDQMLNIGRDTAVSDQIIALNEKIQEVRNPSNFMSYSHLGGKGSEARASFIKNLQEEIRGLQKVHRAETAKAEQAFTEEQARAATISLAEQARAGRSNAEKRVSSRAEIEAEVTRAVTGIVAKSEADRVAQETAIRQNGAKALAAMEKRLADPKAPKAKKSQESKDAERLLRQRAAEYERMSTTLDQHAATLNAAGEAQDKLTSFERFAIKTLSDLENGHTKLDAAQQAETKARIEGLRVIDRQNVEREKQNKLMQIGADLQKRIADFEAAQGRGHADQLRGIGMGAEEANLAATMDDIQNRAIQERIELKEKHGEINAENTAAYLQQLAIINEAEQRQLGNELSQMERRKQAMGDWKNGARAAMDDIAWEMGDVAGRTKDGFMNAFQSMTSALQTFSQTGKLSIRDFATTVIAELLRIALTIAATKALTAMFGSTAIGGAGSSGEQASYDSWFNANNSGPTLAQGGVIAGGATLSSYALGGLPFAGRGGVRRSPTLFSMANGGTGLMGERDPEAVMPLTRGANGKLGVQASGGGGSTFNVSTVVNVHQDGSSDSSTTADNGKEGKRLGEMLDKRVREIIADERRQGGSLWAMQNGR